jgi:hypothetical protein
MSSFSSSSSKSNNTTQQQQKQPQIPNIEQQQEEQKLSHVLKYHNQSTKPNTISTTMQEDHMVLIGQTNQTHFAGTSLHHFYLLTILPLNNKNKNHPFTLLYSIHFHLQNPFPNPPFLNSSMILLHFQLGKAQAFQLGL